MTLKYDYPTVQNGLQFVKVRESINGPESNLPDKTYMVLPEGYEPPKKVFFNADLTGFRIKSEAKTYGNPDFPYFIYTQKEKIGEQPEPEPSIGWLEEQFYKNN